MSPSAASRRNPHLVFFSQYETPSFKPIQNNRQNYYSVQFNLYILIVINKGNMPLLTPLTKKLSLILNMSSDQLTDHIAKIHLNISLPCLSMFSIFPRPFLNKRVTQNILSIWVSLSC